MMYYYTQNTNFYLYNTTMDKPEIVTLQYDDLVAFNPTELNKNNCQSLLLIDQIEAAFGQKGLGILAVQGVPGFVELREELLPLAARLPTLPDLEDTCVDEASSYSTGWSHGREKLAGEGRPDFAKGSYYANPLTEDLVQSLIDRHPNGQQQQEDYWRDQATRHPSFYAPNIWPSRSLPQLQQSFVSMGKLLADVGRLIAVVCDAYCHQNGVETQFSRILTTSLNAKGRLLHYFDMPEASEEDALWCGWHNDHVGWERDQCFFSHCLSQGLTHLFYIHFQGSLTGLVPAMYLVEGRRQITCPDESAGLYIQSRSGTTVRVSLPKSACGFQIGETSQIQSGGLLQATPHAVRSSGGGVSRESFALFLEPEFHDPLKIPPNKTIEDCMGPSEASLPPSMTPLSARWKPGQTFGDFHVTTVTAFAAKDE